MAETAAQGERARSLTTDLGPCLPRQLAKRDATDLHPICFRMATPALQEQAAIGRVVPVLERTRP